MEINSALLMLNACLQYSEFNPMAPRHFVSYKTEFPFIDVKLYSHSMISGNFLYCFPTI